MGELEVAETALVGGYYMSMICSTSMLFFFSEQEVVLCDSR